MKKRHGNWDTWTSLLGNADWRPTTIAFGLGRKTLRWESHGYCDGHDELTTAWVDQVIVASVGRESAPIWITAPQSQTLPAGTNATLSAVVVTYPFATFQWSFNGEPIPEGTNSTLSVSNLQAQHAGTYTVVVSNELGVLTVSVTLQVEPSAPRILVQPASQTVALSRTLTLAVIAQGTDPITHQWRFNDADVPGASGTSLVLSSVTKDATGFYSLALSNSVGVVTSELVRVTVVPIVAWGSYADLNVPHEATDVVAVSAGGNHSVELRRDGTVVGWGWHGDVLPDWTKVVAIDAGGFQSIVLKRDGTVGVAGFCGDLQCDIPAGLSDVVAVASGARHNLALTRDGRVVAWGRNYYDHIPVPSQANNLVDIDAGAYHNVGLRADGTVIAWGNNSLGQTQVPSGLSGVVGIAAGCQYGLALKGDGTVVKWGDNITLLPADLAGVQAIAGGGSHSLALLAPPILAVRPSGLVHQQQTFRISIMTKQGQSYFLEGTDTSTPPIWRLLIIIAGDGSERELTDPSAWVRERFYRVRLVP